MDSAEAVDVVEFEPPLPAESGPPMRETTPVVEAPPVLVECALPAHVFAHGAPAPAESFSGTHSRDTQSRDTHPSNEKKNQAPQPNMASPQHLIHRRIEIPETRSAQGAQTSVSLGPAPARQMMPAETVEMVEFVSPLPAEPVSPMCVATPVVEAPSVVVEHVQPVPMTEYAAPASAIAFAALAPVAEDIAPPPAVTCAAQASVDEYSAPAPDVSYTALAPVVEHIAPAPADTSSTPVLIVEQSVDDLLSHIRRTRDEIDVLLQSCTPVCVSVTQASILGGAAIARLFALATATTRARSAASMLTRVPTISGGADGYPFIVSCPMASGDGSAPERFGLQCGQCT